MKRTLLILTTVIASLLGAAVISNSAQAIDSYGVGALPAYPNKENPRAQSIFIYQLAPGCPDIYLSMC